MTFLKIGAKIEIFAFKIALDSRSILNDFVLSFSISVVTFRAKPVDKQAEAKKQYKAARYRH